MKLEKLSEEVFIAILISVIIGLLLYSVDIITKIHITNPLIVSLLLGIIVRTVLELNRRAPQGSP